ncbi:MAG TPA: hypothetical protein VEV38_01695 [Candidatus Eremiobacteraceae bacterium]|nr:hypothetical protein [Candidatus Eremiobacteraceae bacterium]
MPQAVRSSVGLTNDIAAQLSKEAAAQALPVSAPQSLVDSAARKQRTAIFAIHGISPTQRYAFQDQVAAGLQSCLNAIEQAKQPPSTTTWGSVVYWPQVAQGDNSQTLRPSALRIFQSGDDPSDPQRQSFDVYEGYWSPLSKGKTNIASALKWLLSSIFLPASSTASIPCTSQKLWSDLTYVGALIAKGIAALLLAFVVGFFAWASYLALLGSPTGVPTFVSAITSPMAAIKALGVGGIAELAIDVFAAFLLAQIVVMHRTAGERAERTRELAADAMPTGSQFAQETISAENFHRVAIVALWVTFVVLALIAVAIAVWPLRVGLNHVGELLFSGVLITATVGFFQIARAAADFAVENVLGDIQIYTTHDTNSGYYMIRRSIMQSVADALVGVLRAVGDRSAAEPAPYYDAVHVFGHSLGSTVGMDVLIALRQLVEQGAVTREQWSRVRSFVTFGTSLEKTRFFFDVRQPTINAAQDQWENDVYGRFFTDNIKALAQPDNTGGIYWTNLWYFRDIVANEIVSYASDVGVGSSFTWAQNAPARSICDNHLLNNTKPRTAWIHSDYLGDPAFWGFTSRVLLGP